MGQMSSSQGDLHLPMPSHWQMSICTWPCHPPPSACAAAQIVRSSIHCFDIWKSVAGMSTHHLGLDLPEVNVSWISDKAVVGVLAVEPCSSKILRFSLNQLAAGQTVGQISSCQGDLHLP